jgi:DNA-binding winged helix-turn-helix (wHTH) protein/tetratricopeptide (TPR) repeat protein
MNAPRYEFEGFRLDPQQRLLHTQDGHAVELQPRVFDALLYFVERPGELLGKRELMQALWPSVVVEENSLNQVVSQLRKALGERPSEHRFIVTAPGRGYRWVAAVRTVQPGPADSGAHPLSLAVLPFDDRRAQTGVPELGLAIAADLIRLLSARSRLRVAALTASSAAALRDRDPRQAGRTLNVCRVVTGQIHGDDAGLTLTASVIDVATGAALWNRSLQGNAHTLADLQGDLARDLAQIVDPDAARPAAVSPDAAPEAYLRYLKALSITQHLSPQTVAAAIEELQAAVANSAQFARAHSQLAIQHTTAVMFGFAGTGALDRARREAAIALALDDQNGETWCAAAVIDCLGGNWCRAEERFRIAHTLTADPLVSGLRCAYLTLSLGQLQRALLQAEYTLQVAPTHPIGVQMLAMLHLATGNDEKALQFARLSVELGQSPTMAPLTDMLTQLAMRAGRDAEAAAHLRNCLPERLRTGALDALQLALCGARPEQPEPIASLVAQLDELVRSMTAAELDPPMRKRLLLWYTHLGALDRAFELAFESLDLYSREGTVGGAWGVLWLPEMLRLRRDERFQLFARRLRMFDYWSEYGPPDGHSVTGERLLVLP